MILFILFICSLCLAEDSNVVKEWKNVRGVGVHIVTINVNADDVGVELGRACGGDYQGGRFREESFHSMMRRESPLVAIVGTYFDTVSRRPIGSIVLGGTLICDGLSHSSFEVSKDGSVSISHHPSGTMGRSLSWDGVVVGVGSSPSLVIDGEVDVAPRGFHSCGVTAPARRAAIGVTRLGKVLFVVVPSEISLWKLGWIMSDVGAVDAMNLDGGSSTALWFDGRMVVSPGRRLTHFLMVPSRP